MTLRLSTYLVYVSFTFSKVLMQELDKKLATAKELGAEEKNEISNLNENVEGNDSTIQYHF